MKLSKDFYLRDDVVQIARDLLGKTLCTDIDGSLCLAKITETEAYRGWGDKACHAHLGKTGRNQIMFESGGLAYVYLCYGIHHLFNVVTNKKGNADAVLIRAVEPLSNLEVMKERRGNLKSQYSLTAGPGNMSKALGIDKSHYGQLLTDNVIWIEQGDSIKTEDIIASPRVGIDYAGEDALLPWRFRIKGNKWTSKPK